MTPLTKSGVNFPESAPVGLGWLSLTVHAWTEVERSRVVGGMLTAVGESDPRVREHGVKHYESGLDVLSGSAIGWTEKRPTEVHLTLKQSDCSWGRLAELVELAKECAAWKVTRLDLNYDDATRAASPAAVMDACADGNAVTRVDLDRVQGIVVNREIQSVYVGQRSSDRYLNVYDKDAERAHALKKPVALGTHGIRWELRLKDERATALVQKLMTLRDVDELRETFWAAVTSLVDFRQRAGTRGRGHHLEKLPRLDWFAQLAGQLARQSTYLPRVVESEDVRLWRLNRWIFHSAAALAEWAEKHPHPTIVREMLDYGAERLAEKRFRARAQLATA